MGIIPRTRPVSAWRKQAHRWTQDCGPTNIPNTRAARAKPSAAPPQFGNGQNNRTGGGENSPQERRFAGAKAVKALGRKKPPPGSAIFHGPAPTKNGGGIVFTPNPPAIEGKADPTPFTSAGDIGRGFPRTRPRRPNAGTGCDYRHRVLPVPTGLLRPGLFGEIRGTFGHGRAISTGGQQPGTPPRGFAKQIQNKTMPPVAPRSLWQRHGFSP